MKQLFMRHLLVVLTLLNSFSLHAQETSDNLKGKSERYLTVSCEVAENMHLKTFASIIKD